MDFSEVRKEVFRWLSRGSILKPLKHQVHSARLKDRHVRESDGVLDAFT